MRATSIALWCVMENTIIYWDEWVTVKTVMPLGRSL